MRKLIAWMLTLCLLLTGWAFAQEDTPLTEIVLSPENTWGQSLEDAVAALQGVEYNLQEYGESAFIEFPAQVEGIGEVTGHAVFVGGVMRVSGFDTLQDPAMTLEAVKERLEAVFGPAQAVDEDYLLALLRAAEGDVSTIDITSMCCWSVNGTYVLLMDEEYGGITVALFDEAGLLGPGEPAAVEETFSLRDGITWGQSLEQVLALEGSPACERLTDQFRYREGVEVCAIDGVAVAGVTGELMLILDNDSLVVCGYALSAQDVPMDALVAALESKYGPAQPMDLRTMNAALAALYGGDPAGTYSSATSGSEWTLPDGTYITLAEYSSGILELVYYDAPTLLAEPVAPAITTDGL